MRPVWVTAWISWRGVFQKTAWRNLVREVIEVRRHVVIVDVSNRSFVRRRPRHPQQGGQAGHNAGQRRLAETALAHAVGDQRGKQGQGSRPDQHRCRSQDGRPGLRALPYEQCRQYGACHPEV